MKTGRISVIIVLMFFSCDYMDTRLELKSVLEQDVYFLVSESDTFRNSNPLYIIKNDTIIENSSKLKKEEELALGKIGKNGWEYFIKEKCKDETLHLFIFNENLIFKEKWDSIYKHQKYSSKYSYTLEELKKNNWIIEIGGNGSNW